MEGEVEGLGNEGNVVRRRGGKCGGKDIGVCGEMFYWRRGV